MKTLLLAALCMALYPVSINAMQCAPGRGELVGHSVETAASKLRYSDMRAPDSVDLDVTLEATSRLSMKQLDSVYELAEAIFEIDNLYFGDFTTAAQISARAVRVEGEHGRAKCFFFKPVKPVKSGEMGIVFVEGNDSGDFKVCVSEEGRVVSRFRMGGAIGGVGELVLSVPGLKVRLSVPDKGSGTFTYLFSVTSTGCKD